MTRILVILIVLYATWRLATILAKRREREQQKLYERLTQNRSNPPILERCDRCGDYRSPLELHGTGGWLSRRVCADGCSGFGTEGQIEPEE